MVPQVQLQVSGPCCIDDLPAETARQPRTCWGARLPHIVDISRTSPMRRSSSANSPPPRSRNSHSRTEGSWGVALLIYFLDHPGDRAARPSLNPGLGAILASAPVDLITTPQWRGHPPHDGIPCSSETGTVHVVYANVGERHPHGRTKPGSRMTRLSQGTTRPWQTSDTSHALVGVRRLKL